MTLRFWKLCGNDQRNTCEEGLVFEVVEVDFGDSPFVAIEGRPIGLVSDSAGVFAKTHLGSITSMLKIMTVWVSIPYPMPYAPKYHLDMLRLPIHRIPSRSIWFSLFICYRAALRYFMVMEK